MAFTLGDSMKKINILKNSRDFTRIIKSFKSVKYKDYIIYVEKKEPDVYKFGFSVGKKIGNAVTRNKIKRQLKNILDKKRFKNNFNCVIIVGRGILARSFAEREENLIKILTKLDLIKEHDDE